MGLGEWLSQLVKPTESLIALDIGSSAIKLLELDCTEHPHKIIDAEIRPTPSDVFNGYAISQPQKIGQILAELISEGRFTGKRFALAVPAPAVFVKRIKTPRMSPNELAENISFEARNVIPHNIEAVSLDFHILGASGKNQLDVLVVAVKNEVLDSYLACLSEAGLGAGLVDVDYFAAQNCFEFLNPQTVEETMAILHMGHRFTSLSICRAGAALFNGDIQIGTKMLTEALSENLGMTEEQAEAVKRELANGGDVALETREALHDVVEHIAFECNRQLSFFWNASGSDAGIDRIMLAGSGALYPELLSALAQKTGIETDSLSPIEGLAIGHNIDEKRFSTLWPLFDLCVGLGFRQPGDRDNPDYD